MESSKLGRRDKDDNLGKIIVKNLPKNQIIPEKDLQEHFSRKNMWPTTSCDFIKSLGIAYIVYQEPINAEKSIDYFKRTYFKQFRIDVAKAIPKVNPSSAAHTERKAPEFERNIKGSPENEHENKRQKLMALYGDSNDPELKAFLKQMQGTSQKKTWGNDDHFAAASHDDHSKNGMKAKNDKEKNKNKNVFKGYSDDDDGDYQDLPKVMQNDDNELSLEDLSSAEELGGDESENEEKVEIATNVPETKVKIDFFAGAPQTSLDPHFDGKPISYKQKMNMERRQKLATPITVWSSFYINHDAVMECVSKQLGIKKINLLNPESSQDMASRVALAETHVIQETKNYLLQEGVQLDNIDFSSTLSLQKSKTTILIKNIPFTTEEEEIASLFTPFGTILRIILPPSKVMAIVEFSEATDASNAFKNLAYRKFKHIPLYLEWIPEGLVTQPTKKPSRAFAYSNNPLSNFVLNEKEQQSILAKEDLVSATSSESSTLFIKNISFSTKENDLARLFENYPGFVRCSLSTRKDAKKPGQLLSCGYGFVEFKDVEFAQSALIELKNIVLDGHILIFKYSQQNAQTFTTAPDINKNTKIIIRNIPFEATAKDVKTLFQPFGQIKKLRLPKKFDGTHRGFGFIEFSSHQQATLAFDAVRHSHIYGRHLVLEWAKNEENGVAQLQELKQKSSQQIRLLQTKGPRKQGKIVQEEQDELAILEDSDENSEG